MDSINIKGFLEFSKQTPAMRMTLDLVLNYFIGNNILHKGFFKAKEEKPWRKQGLIQ